MRIPKIFMALLPLSTISLAAPAGDTFEVSEAADALEKRTISQYVPHKRCLVKKNELDPAGKYKIDYEKSWGITTGCCFGCRGAQGCEMFCDPRVGTCCQVPGPTILAFQQCCEASSAQGAHDPHMVDCNPAANWAPGKNNCKNPKRGLEGVSEVEEVI